MEKKHGTEKKSPYERYMIEMTRRLKKELGNEIRKRQLREMLGVLKPAVNHKSELLEEVDPEFKLS